MNPDIEKIRNFPIRYMEEVFNQRKFNVLDELYSPSIIDRVKNNVMPFLNAFPDWHGTVDDIIVEGNKVVNRWSGHGTHSSDSLGFPATGKPVTMNGITIFQIEENKIIEDWSQSDVVSMMRQLGLIQ